MSATPSTPPAGSQQPLAVSVEVRGLAETVARLRRALRPGERRPLHQAMADDAGMLARRHVSRLNQHATAQRLGARPTRHLARVARGIEAAADESAGILLIPAASRLRAAFGPYVIRPGAGKKYLTIPVHPAAYGRRAGEIPGLVFIRTGANGTPILARQAPSNRPGAGLEAMYVLVRSARIPEDRTLLPWPEIPLAAARAATTYIQAMIDATPPPTSPSHAQ
jgi:hypothetical protein